MIKITTATKIIEKQPEVSVIKRACKMSDKKYAKKNLEAVSAALLCTWSLLLHKECEIFARCVLSHFLELCLFDIGC